MNKDQRIAARLAAHHEQMKRYEADGYSRSEASIRAAQDMQIIPAAPAPADEPDTNAVDDALAERDRYRAALEKIARTAGKAICSADIARDALAGE
jgi:hypothetical protein